MLTQQEVQRRLDYDPLTGAFLHRVGRLAGQIAGSTNRDGYVLIMLDRKSYQAHRLAFLHVEGVMPEEVDHKDRNPTNNRWHNLRPSNRSGNNLNRSAWGASGLAGVRLRAGKWEARAYVNGREKVLGRFSTPEQAVEARQNFLRL